MARKSSLKTMDPAIQAAVMQAMENGSTIDEIVEMLADKGLKRSRSAVGRYAKQYGDLAARHRDMRSVAEAFASEFGGSENAEGKLMVQMLTSIGARMIMPMAAEETPDIGAKEFHALAKATRELQSAAKIDADRDARIRDEATKTARAKAATDAESAARSSGASEETIARVKAKILGLEE
ncbi:phage protein Gp27 family protein [Sphingobium aromaticiconvertens]|uniref:phage protein Gp27 family protein n=1 Tax=Sphingobium aromaticiconvertens TaxID=365341 RepID=UPI00301905CE